MRYLLPIVAGVLCAVCWTVWAGAVAAKNPWLTTAAEFGLLAICWTNWRWMRDGKNAEWWCYAVASAVASGFVVAIT